ncbi:MAG: asparaginase [bacterium]|nr:asparaginase [bacterium]
MSKSPSVYVLYTGGTIGMWRHPLIPMSAKEFKEHLSKEPGFTTKSVTVQTPEDKNYDIDYTLESFQTPIDSSSMTPGDWVRIAERILDKYDRHQGFVVLHGTDTMAWTASALSYLLDGLTKPVIVTGSQIPLAQTRNDGLRNLVTSIILAATSEIPESCLFFNVDLMRGNRTVKVNASEFKGFASPKFPPLATVGIETTVNRHLVLAPPPASISLDEPQNRENLKIQLQMLKREMTKFSVVPMLLFPGIQASMVEAIFTSTTPPVKGMVLEAFGEGDAPSTTAFLEVLKKYIEAGVTIVDDTQCLMGTVNIGAYMSADGLRKAGVISGYDMTPEATLTKLIYMIARGLSPAEVKTLMQTKLHGDLTPPVSSNA